MVQCCFLYGGLGNQLYQIFAAANIALELNVPLKCLWKPHGTPRKCMNHIVYHVDELSQQDLRFMKVQNEEKPFLYTSLPKADNTIINGYFQHRDYFSNNFQQIVESLKIQVPKESLPGTVIHIRRTDYLSPQNKNFFVQLSTDQFCSQRVLECPRPLTLVTDDCNDPFVKEICQKLGATIHKTISDLDDFWFISKHDFIVCANSTFSYWAAKFATYRNPHCRVILPKSLLTSPSLITF